MSYRPSHHKITACEPICVECGGMGKMKSGEQAYPHKREKHGQVFFVCDCGAIVSCHPGTAVPAGRPGSAATRALRYEAHKALDALWGVGRRTAVASGHARTKAYKWLARQLDIKPSECHIGWFNADQLRRVIEICRAAKGVA